MGSLRIMPKKPKRPAQVPKVSPPVTLLCNPSEEEGFHEILARIHAARGRAQRAVNLELVGLYWSIGEYLNRRVTEDGWGRSTVRRLAAWLQSRERGIRGFSAINLWRMRRFFVAYAGDQELAPVVRELPWASNLLILGKCKLAEERRFYLRVACEQRWSKRELERQIDGALFERTISGKPIVSRALREQHPRAEAIFKDRYLLEFLQLPHDHRECDLQRALIANLRQFLCELGRDFCFVGEQFCVQVGTQDFFMDLLFFHRGLAALVAVELKIDGFKPSHLGQLEFYLEALDRDHRKAHEGPSIGLLLCKTRDAEVVEYALSRTLSPALVAEYETQLPDRRLLRSKLDEFYELIAGDGSSEV
jgi:predicted nuclease of restriction endonuclease-like (RecB) superfamily